MRSDYELRLERAMRRRGFPGLARSTRVTLGDGSVVHPDLGIPEDGFFVEVDHLTWHGGRGERVRPPTGHQGPAGRVSRRAGHRPGHRQPPRRDGERPRVLWQRLRGDLARRNGVSLPKLGRGSLAGAQADLRARSSWPRSSWRRWPRGGGPWRHAPRRRLASSAAERSITVPVTSAPPRTRSCGRPPCPRSPARRPCGTRRCTGRPRTRRSARRRGPWPSAAPWPRP